MPDQVHSGIYDPEFGHVLAYTPDAYLLPDHRYTVVVGMSLRDQQGRGPRSEYRRSFLTAAR